MYTTNASRGLPRHRSRHLTERYTRWAMRGVIAVLVIALLWLVLAFHLNGQWMFALLFLLHIRLAEGGRLGRGARHAPPASDKRSSSLFARQLLSVSEV